VRNCFAIFLCAFVLGCTASCGPANPSAEETTAMESPTTGIATPEEIKAEEQRVKDLFQSLDEGKISKLIFVQVTPNGYNKYESDDKEAIAAWVDVFHQMEIKGMQFEYRVGISFSVSIVEGDREIYLCSMDGSEFYDTSWSVMYRIENYDELCDSIEAAKDMVSERLL